MRIVIPATILILLLVSCFAGPAIFALPDQIGGSVLQANLPIASPGHLLGTDLNGNDVLARLLYGGRASLQIALAANLIGLLAGGALGAQAGWSGGIVDTLTMRGMDMLIAFPSLILVLAIAQTRGPGELNTILALSALSVPACARISRIATIRLKSRPFITAARLAGTGGFRILASHVGPNIAPQLAGFALLGIGISMTLEGALSYLGLGVPIPEASWGGMIRHGQEGLLLRPDLVLIPAAALFTVVLCANWLGTALRERWS